MADTEPEQKKAPLNRAKFKMMELLEAVLINEDSKAQGLSIAEILNHASTTQETTPDTLFPRLVDIMKTAEDMGVIERLKNSKYTLAGDAPNTTVMCGSCAKRRDRQRFTRMRKRSSRSRRRR